LSTVGELRPPRFPKAPKEVGSLSTPPRFLSTAWQELQDWVLLAESFFSKNSSRPSFTRAAVSFSDPGILSGIGASTFEALERKSEAVAAFNAAGASKNADTVKA